MKLIAQHGIQHLTTKNIAAAMNFSEPAIYRHFKSKTAILEGILHFYRDQMKVQVQKILLSKDNSLEKLLKMLEIQFKHFVANPSLSVVIFSESIFQHEESLSITVKKIIDNKFRLSEQLILKGQAEGVIRDDISASDLATMYIGTIRFTLLRWKLADYNIDLNKEAKKISVMITALAN